MKLASLDDGARDGRLVVVSRDLTRCSDARHVAPTLQAALDDWDRLAPQLELIARGIETGGQPVSRFHERDALAPLPRAYELVGGAAYVRHASSAEAGAADPRICQRGSDRLRAPRAPIPLGDEAWALDLEAEVAVIVGDVPMGADRATALAAIRLVTLLDGPVLRALAPQEFAQGFGHYHARPDAGAAPVVVTPTTLGAAWDGARLHGALQVEVNGRRLGRLDAGLDMDFDFGELIVHATRTRALGAGAIVASGAVSNRGGDGGPGAGLDEGGRGHGCIAEARMIESLRVGGARTSYLGFGDLVRIELRDAGGHSIFGAIERQVLPLADRDLGPSGLSPADP